MLLNVFSENPRFDRECSTMYDGERLIKPIKFKEAND